MTAKNFDVVIIGGGVAGPALACALRDSGLAVALLEKSADPPDTARGDHLQPTTCEIFERWGMLDRLFAAGAEKRPGSVWMTQNGERLMHSNIGALDIPHPYFAYLNHEHISSLLLDCAADNERFELFRPIRNWWLDEDNESGVTLRVGLVDGTEQALRTQVLVGADGRASRTRKLAGINSTTHRYDRAIGILFAKREVPEPIRDLHVYVSDTNMISVIPRAGGGCKIGVPMSPSDATAWRGLSGAELSKRLHRLVPAERIRAPRFGDVYPPIYLKTEAWSAGRIVLIGDACHAMHPARSQGMNVAIRCVNALAQCLTAEPLSNNNVEARLRAYEQAVRPDIERILDDNHERGMIMDRAVDNSAFIKSLRELQINAESLHRYTLNAAGYGSR